MFRSTKDAELLPLSTSRDVLTDILRRGAHDLLAQAVEAEVQEWIEDRQSIRNDAGLRQVVRNGYMPERTVTTGIGPVTVQQPRVHDRRPAEQREKFTSAILPPYLRKTKSLEELIPWLYLKGVSTGDFSEALTALVGADSAGLSASTITRLKDVWEQEYQQWSQRSLADKHYVYVWADGIHCNVRLSDDRPCLLVLLGATADGRKELIALVDGHRESELSWKELLLDVKSRGLTIDPKLAIGDGALGFWKAVRQVWPAIRSQRCWVHKTANVLDKMAKGIQPRAKSMLHDIYLAESRAAANKAFDLFVQTYEAKFPKATECLTKDRDELLTFYDFPAEHWGHLRTTNPIESVFATVRLRTYKTKGCGTTTATITMAYKLMESASKRWHSLKGSALMEDVIRGIPFVDGIKTNAA
jgi:putative transposase